MGYYSEVCLCLTKNGKNFLDTHLQSTSSETGEELQNLLSNADKHMVDQKTDCEVWYWTAIKWYSETPEIDFLETFMAEIPQKDYRFLRIGDHLEDNEDNGQLWNLPFDIHIARNIKFETMEM